MLKQVEAVLSSDKAPSLVAHQLYRSLLKQECFHSKTHLALLPETPKAIAE